MEDHLAIQCSGEEYGPWYGLSLFGVFLYGLGLPALLVFQVHRHRRELHLPTVKASLGFLYNGYEHRCCFWEGVAMSRKVLVRLAALVPSANIRVLLLVALSLVFLGAHMHY